MGRLEPVYLKHHSKVVSFISFLALLLFYPGLSRSQSLKQELSEDLFGGTIQISSERVGKRMRSKKL